MKEKDLNETIEKAFDTVYEKLGYGFSREIYEKALMMELDTRNVQYCFKTPVNVYYDGVSVGKCIPDFLIGYDTIVIISTEKSISGGESSKLESYCETTCCDRGFLLNFGISPEVKVYHNGIDAPCFNMESEAVENISESYVVF